MCTLHKAGPGRRQPAEAIIPLYHIFAKKSSEKLHKKIDSRISQIVHYDEALPLTAPPCLPVLAPYAPICH